MAIKSLEERLDQYVMPEPNSGCHLWIGALNNMGYAVANFGRKKPLAYVHRLVWEKHHGPIPKKMYVCHKCDTPCCVNLDHFFLGNHAANQADMGRKGRNHKVKKLSPDQVRQILKREVTAKEYAAKFGVSPVTVMRIWQRRFWKHVQ